MFHLLDTSRGIINLAFLALAQRSPSGGELILIIGNVNLALGATTEPLKIILEGKEADGVERFLKRHAEGIML